MKLIITCVLFIAFSVINAQSPPNDLVENAIEIKSFPYIENQINFIDASTGRDDPHGCTFTGFNSPHRSIYYKFTATKDIDIKTTLNIDGVNLDNGCGFFSPKPCAIIIFYSAPNLNITDVNNLTSLSSCNNHSNSTISVKAGNHYYIGIYSEKTSKGLIDLNISELNGNISDEKEILLNFYQSTGGDSWKNNMNWKTSTPLKDWFGITVNEDNKVTK